MSEELPEEPLEPMCKHCRFWDHETPLTYGNADRIYGDGFHAACRRFPKTFVGGEPQFLYEQWEHPTTHDFDWCGEFQPLKDTP